MSEELIEAPPTIEELAAEKLAAQLKYADEIKTGTLKHYEYLPTLMQAFSGEEWEAFEPWFSLESYELYVLLYKVEDINKILKKIHGAMRKAGFKPRGLFDTEGLSWIWRPENSTEYYPSIRIGLSLADGGKCKRVKVGTKKVPVYEIQCDGESIVTPEIEEDSD